MHRTAQIKKLAGSKRGANHSIPEKTYQGYVRPVLEYGISSSGQTTSSNFHKIKEVQHQNFRLTTGGMKSTSILEMATLSGLQVIEDRRNNKALIQAEKFKQLNSFRCSND